MFKKDVLSEAVEAEQLRLFSEASGLDPDSKEFADHIKHIIGIDAVKTKKSRVSKDAIVGAAASLIGIFAVLYFEKTGAVISKSFSLVPKPKI